MVRSIRVGQRKNALQIPQSLQANYLGDDHHLRFVHFFSSCFVHSLIILRFADALWSARCSWSARGSLVSTLLSVSTLLLVSTLLSVSTWLFGQHAALGQHVALWFSTRLF
jgi:hypothetical protein